MCNVIDTISGNYLGTPIFPCTCSNGWHVLAHKPHYFTVNFNHHCPLHACVLQDTPQDAAVSGADDQHTPGSAMLDHRDVGNHLLISKLISLGDLDDTI